MLWANLRFTICALSRFVKLLLVELGCFLFDGGGVGFFVFEAVID